LRPVAFTVLNVQPATCIVVGMSAALAVPPSPPDASAMTAATAARPTIPDAAKAISSHLLRLSVDLAFPPPFRRCGA
jgi:hypothetical protein